MKLTAICCGRNDDYGGHLVERATYAFNSMLKTFDEVIYVDWNTDEGKKVLTDELVLKNREKLTVYEVTPSMVKDIMGDEPAQSMCEVMARNIAIRRATGDVIVSTNIDIIVPPREQMDILVSKMKPNQFYTVARHDVHLHDLQKVFGDDVDIQDKLPVVFGVNAVSAKYLSPYLNATKELLEKYEEKEHHVLASVICACGDFQVAHKNVWFDVRGFEEFQKRRSYNDTTIQYKVIMAGNEVVGTNFPPVYHIDHKRDHSTSPSIVNDKNDMPRTTRNDENWGCVLKM